jgi:hypothetical protein
MGVDPVGFQEDNLHSFNRYAYANNNPYRYVDPDGRYAFLVSMALYALTALSAALTVQTIWHGNGGSRQGNVEIGTLSFPGHDIGHPNSWNVGQMHNEGTDAGGETLRFPDRELPKDSRTGRPVADPEAEGAYTQLGQREGRKGTYDQAREFDARGNPVRDIDFTDHGRPQNHTNPHQHDFIPNPTGGTPRHGPAKPLW